MVQIDLANTPKHAPLQKLTKDNFDLKAPLPRAVVLPYKILSNEHTHTHTVTVLRQQ
jgi:hypothetical protein